MWQQDREESRNLKSANKGVKSPRGTIVTRYHSCEEGGWFERGYIQFLFYDLLLCSDNLNTAEKNLKPNAHRSTYEVIGWVHGFCASEQL